MYLVDPHKPREGLGDCLCSLHNSIANTDFNDTIYIQKSKHKDFYNKIVYPRLQLKDTYKRNFIYVDNLPTPNIDVAAPSKELLPIFQSQSEDKIVFNEYPPQEFYPPFVNKIKYARGGKRRKHLLYQCMKRTFKKNWKDFILPFAIEHGYETIDYYETDIEKVFTTIANAKIVIGAEGGIYHLTVLFGKPFIMVLPDLIYNCTSKFRKACLRHNLRKHQTYPHKFIQESKFFDEIFTYL